MDSLRQQLTDLLRKRAEAPIRVFTLGNFRVLREDEEIAPKAWGRDTALQLFQFLVTARERRGLHKEQIIDRIWEDADMKSGEQTFKVALHGANKALEPDRPSRTEPRFILRQGITYQLNSDEVWIDADATDGFIGIGNQALAADPDLAETAYREAINLHHGVYLPNRLYEDWSSAERERLQVLILNALTALSELLIEKNPAESIRLTQSALLIDATWEDAHRIQMQAYLEKGNRPAAIKAYRNCIRILDEEFGIGPLPDTQKVYEKIMEK